MKKAIRCIRIGVDCIVSVPVDACSGGLEYLGFDFNVKKEEAEEMKKFIVNALNSFEIPLSSIFCYGEVDLSEDNVWTKEKIIEELIKIGKTINDLDFKPYNYVHSNDEEMIANMLDNFEYDPSKREKVLTKYDKLKKHIK